MTRGSASQALCAGMVLAGAIFLLEGVHPLLTADARMAVGGYVVLASAILTWRSRPRARATPAPAPGH